MLVKELVEKLQKLDQEKEIEIYGGGTGEKYEIFSISFPSEDIPEGINEDDFSEDENDERMKEEIKKEYPEWKPSRYEITIID